MPSEIRVLHVDDDPSVTDLTATFLEEEHDRFTVETATSADEGLEMIDSRSPDCVVSAYEMPGMDGLEFLQAVREEYPDHPFILFTDEGSEHVASEAISAGVTDYLRNESGPAADSLLANRIVHAVDSQRRKRRMKFLRTLANEVTELSIDFLRTGERDIDSLIDETLEKLGTLVDAGRTYVFDIDQEVETLSNTHEWCTEGVEPQIHMLQDIPQDTLPWLMQKLENFEKITIPKVSELPPEADAERDILQEQNIESLIVTPMISNDELVGFMGFDWVEEQDAWSDEFINIQRMVSELITTARKRNEREQELRELTERHNLAVKGANLGVWDWNLQTDAVTFNEQWAEMLGLSLDEIEPTLDTWEQRVHPGDIDEVNAALDAHRGGETDYYETEHRMQTAAGEWKWIRDIGRIVEREEDGDPIRAVGIHVDIDERKERERQLDRERKRYARLFETLPNPVLHATAEDGEPIVETVNPAFENRFGYDSETIRNESIQEYVLPDDRADTANQLNKQVLREGEVQTEVQRETTDGIRTFRLNVRTSDADGEGGEGYAVYTDITEQKQLERALKQERDLVKGIVETVPVGLSVVDADGSILFVNERLETISGRSLEEIENMPYDAARYDLVDEHGEPLEAGETPFNRVASRETTIHNQIVGIRRPSGERVWLSVSGAPQYDDDGELERTVFAFEDITEQRELETELSEIFGRVSDAFFALDDEFQFTHVNSHAEELLEAPEEELLGETVWEMYPETAETDTIRDAFTSAMDTQTPLDFELYYEPLEFWVEASVYPSENGISVYFRDVTERKEREQELQRKTRAIEEAPIGITLSDASQPDNPLTYVNDRFVRMTGYQREDVLGRNCRFLQGERTWSEQVDTLRTGVENQEPTSVELLNYRKDGTEFWNRVTVAPVHDDTGELVNYVGFQQDVTEQRRNQQRLEQRERVLRKLHTATRECYPPSAVSEVADFLVDFISGAFEFPYVSFKRFDEDTGCLEPAGRSSTFTEDSGSLGPVQPGPNPIWRAYEQNEPHRITDDQHADVLNGIDASINYGLAFPTGEFGVIVACTGESETIKEVDLELIEVVAANAESMFQRLHTAETHTDVTAQLAAKEDKVEELTELINTIEELHGSLAQSESRDSLYESVCETLTGIKRIDFAWIGRPQGVKTSLRPASWAGQESGYLNAIDPNSSDELLPAQRAASEHDICSIQNIGSHVRTGVWAKRALTVGFRSVISVPLVYDGVLYGVLSVYSGEEDAFEQEYTDLVTNIAALLISYSATLESRYQASNEEYTILEFELADPAYPFHQLAVATDARIRFDSVAEVTDTGVRVFVTIVEGDPGAVLDQAPSVSSIAGLTPIGDTSESRFSVTVRKPFLASIVGKHGANLRDVVSDSDGTMLRVEVPANTSKRPVFDALTSEYREISPVAQRQKTHPDMLDAGQVEDILTERQHEILRAAFYGGYYEAPKEITGEDLATNFDISNTAVYKHLQAGHQKILEAIFEQSAIIRAKGG